MQVTKKALRVVMSVLLALTLFSCGSKPQFGAVVSDIINSDTMDINVTLQVSDTLNPNARGRPSPVMLSIYQLKNDTKFAQSSVSQLLDKPEEVIAADVLGEDQKMVFPGENQEYELTIQDTTLYIGVFAAFQQEGEFSKRLISLDGGWSKDICITLGENSVTSAERC